MQWIDTELVRPRLGITDALEAELRALASNPEAAITIFSRMVSVRARVGWSTHGHSAVDVNIYSSGGRGAEKIRGNVENTEVGQFLSQYLDVDVDEITEELQQKLKVRPGAEQVEVPRGGEDGFDPRVHPVAWMGMGAPVS